MTNMKAERTAGALLIGIILLLNSTSSGKRISSFAGPYRIIVNRISNVTDDFNSTGKFYVKIFGTHPNAREPQYLWGITNVNTEINDDMTMQIKIAVRNSNQWKRNAFVMNFERACTSFMTQAMSIINYAYLPNERRCPLPRTGLRKQENRTWEYTFPGFPIMPYNRYRFSLAMVTKDKEDVGVVVADVDVVPRL